MYHKSIICQPAIATLFMEIVQVQIFTRLRKKPRVLPVDECEKGIHRSFSAGGCASAGYADLAPLRCYTKTRMEVPRAMPVGLHLLFQSQLSAILFKLSLQDVSKK